MIGLEVGGAPFFLAQPEGNRWESPAELGTTTVRVEVFVDDPDRIDDARLKQLGAAGVVKRGKVAQVVMGTQSDRIAERINRLLKGGG